MRKERRARPRIYRAAIGSGSRRGGGTTTGPLDRSVRGFGTAAATDAVDRVHADAAAPSFFPFPLRAIAREGDRWATARASSRLADSLASGGWLLAVLPSCPGRAALRAPRMRSRAEVATLWRCDK